MPGSEPEHGPEGPEPEPISPWPSPFSAVSAVLENDDLLTVILRHLPPRPSSLPRASLVCKLWLSSATSQSFLRDFRAFHRASQPLLGLFHNSYLGGSDRRFVATADLPDRVPASSFRVPFGWEHRRWRFLDCRHGRALLLGPAGLGPGYEVLVWDPMTGERLHVPLPPDAADIRHGAVLCSCSDERDCRSSHFQVVLVWFELLPSTQQRRALAAVYSSESGAWSPTITVQVPYLAAASIATKPGLLARNGAVYWLVPGGRILEFDAEARSLAVVSVPSYAGGSLYWRCQLVLTEAKELGFAMLATDDMCIMLWKRDIENVCGWSVYRSVELDGRIPPRNPMQEQPSLLGFHEGSNAIFVWTEAGGVFMINLESMQSKLLCMGDRHFEIYPFSGFYTGGAHGYDDDVDAPPVLTPEPTMDTLNMWHYEDLVGNLHGPYAMVRLCQWSMDSCFVAGEDFRVWKTDETKDQGVLLIDAMRTTAHRLLGPPLEVGQSSE